MKRIMTILAAAALLLTASLAFAAEVPELRGTWKGDSFVNTEKGFKKTQAAYVIDAQEGQLFKGYKLWFNSKNVLQQEPFTGIFGDDGNLYFAEKDDGYAVGQRTSKQTMSIYYLERGATYKAVLYKLERVFFTTGFVEIDKDGDTMIIQGGNFHPLPAQCRPHHERRGQEQRRQADQGRMGNLEEGEQVTWAPKHE